MKLLLAVIVLLASCSSSRKAAITSRQELDSTVSHIRDTLSIRKSDSIGIQKDNSIFSDNTDSTYEKTTIEEEIKYVSRTDRNTDSSTSRQVDAEPGTIVTIIRRTIREKGTKKTESKAHLDRSDSSAMSRVDSSAGRNQVDASIRKTQVEKSKIVTRKRFLPGFMWVLALLLIAWLARRFYLWKTKGISFFTFNNNKPVLHDKTDQTT